MVVGGALVPCVGRGAVVGPVVAAALHQGVHRTARGERDDQGDTTSSAVERPFPRGCCGCGGPYGGVVPYGGGP